LSASQHPGHDRDELDDLQARLTEIGPEPGWFLATGAEGLLRAERPGTQRFEVASMTPRGLLEAVEKREREIASGNAGARSQVVTGLGSTANTPDVKR
jgi:hypothetical protein